MRLHCVTRPRQTRQLPSQADFGSGLRRGGQSGWGGRDRTSEWRNQNPLQSSIKSTGILIFHVRSTIDKPIGILDDQNKTSPQKQMEIMTTKTFALAITLACGVGTIALAQSP